MEPLYETVTVMDYGEYKKFYNMIYNSTWTSWALLVFVIVFFGGNGLYLLNTGSFVEGGFALFLAIFMPIGFEIQKSRHARKQFKELLQLQGTENKFEFYEDRVEIHAAIGYNRYEYEMFQKIVETKENYYLMLTQNRGFVIIKRACSAELCQFIVQLKERIGDKKSGN